MLTGQETKILKAYLAGPDVFLANAIEIGIKKKVMCDNYGFKGLFPFDNEIDECVKNTRIDHVIYQANVSMMEEADFIIVNLTPFRGPSADVGSVFELGLMTGMRKPAFGYTNVGESMENRLIKSGLAAPDPETGMLKDTLGMSVENFGNLDNLMIDSCLDLQGHSVVVCNAKTEDVFNDLTGFETCLKMAQAHFAKSRPKEGFHRHKPVRIRARFG